MLDMGKQNFIIRFRIIIPCTDFSDEYLPREDDLNIGLDTFDNTRMMLFNENRVYANLLKEKKFEFFANSFFIEVTK